MKNIKDYILENSKDDVFYAVYFSDGTMYNFYDTKEDAEIIKAQLNSECADNKCIIKTEPKSQFMHNK